MFSYAQLTDEASAFKPFGTPFHQLRVVYRIGQSNPGWEMEPTAGSELRGVQILHMVVLIPNNTHATGIVTIKADIFKEGWLWNYHARNRKDGGEEVLKIDLPGVTS
jgi:hypothetical protein